MINRLWHLATGWTLAAGLWLTHTAAAYPPIHW